MIETNWELACRTLAQKHDSVTSPSKAQAKLQVLHLFSFLNFIFQLSHLKAASELADVIWEVAKNLPVGVRNLVFLGETKIIQIYL